MARLYGWPLGVANRRGASGVTRPGLLRQLVAPSTDQGFARRVAVDLYLSKLVSGTGSLVAPPASTGGAGSRIHVGSGTAVAPPAIADGAGARVHAGGGAVVAPPASIVGAVGKVWVGIGALIAPPATVLGDGALIVVPGIDFSGPQNLGLLIRGQFDSGDFAAFTGLGTLVWGGVTYLGTGQALQIGETATATGGEFSGLTISLVGVDPEVIAIAEVEEFQRRRVDVYLARFDDQGQIIEADTFFSGLADDMASDDDPANPVLVLSCEARALDLNRPRPFKYLPEDQQRRFPGDTFFDLVAAIQNREDTWGR